MAGAATVEKALDVLFHLHEAGSARGLGEVARALGLAKSSCHRLLAALAERELVEQDEAGRYRPGLGLLSLGLGVQRREPVVELARDFLEAEAAELGETVFLVAERRGTLRVLDKCEGSGFLRAAPGVGDRVPADVTAAGKLYRIHRAPIRAAGPADAPDPRAPLLDPGDPLAPEERARILACGYAVNRNAWIEGLSVLGVPIGQPMLGGGMKLAAVLALAAATPRFDALGESRIAERLRRAAAAISERLAGTQASAPRADRRESVRNAAEGAARRPAGQGEK